MSVLAIKLLLAYLLGSISGSLLLGALYGVDIRKSGSGNAGGTNAYRTQGFIFALAVVIIDIGKGVLAALVLPALTIPAFANSMPLAQLAPWCGFAAIIGHCYPLYHGFRGGKGAGTLLGVLAVIAPWSLLPMLVVWVLVLIAWGYVGLATISAGFSMAIAVLWAAGFELNSLSVFALVSAFFLLFTHRSNIAKMRHGNEYRFERAWYKNWRK